jgi:hypothetical protein
MTNGQPEEIGLLWRIILIFVGFSIAVLGFSLIMSVILSFIGLPLLFVGFALVEALLRP